VVANEPPIGSLFSAFLGYNPIRQLLGPTGALQHMAPDQVAYVTGRSFFPQLISEPFAYGMHLAFTFAGIATGIAVIASARRGGATCISRSRSSGSWPRAPRRVPAWWA